MIMEPIVSTLDTTDHWTRDADFDTRDQKTHGFGSKWGRDHQVCGLMADATKPEDFSREFD